MRIAVIEPNQDDLFLIEHLLRQCNHKVICISHSKGAMALGPNEADAIIMEYDQGPDNPSAADICWTAVTWKRWVPCLVHTDHPDRIRAELFPPNTAYREKGKDFKYIIDFLKLVQQ